MLKPCPFCGAEVTRETCDRLITIGCEPCGYRRPFPGLLSTTPNDKPILEYRKADGTIDKISPEEAIEFYHSDASERAEEEWNKRSDDKGLQRIPINQNKR